MTHAKLLEKQRDESVKITQLHLQLKIHLSSKMCNSLCPAADWYTKAKKPPPAEYYPQHHTTPCMCAQHHLIEPVLFYTLAIRLV